ncbi:MAG TPA: rhomboid family intramembrane serine protease [Streptosporangiaceae bacterium]|nr:rhomboid family intramembrane serine protease [Streptosporangiaceae bacterium]
MTSVPDKIAKAAWSVIPAPLEQKLRTEAGKRFSRFILVAVAAVITSQVVLGVLTGPVNLSAGASGVIASMVAALVSYLLSRWAWERKGKPDLLRETLPFWVVSIAVWIVLGLTSHYASVWAHSMGYTHLMKHVVVQGAYFLMNCVTFVARFLIFHYVLFTDKSKDEEAAATVGADLATAEAPVGGSSGSDTGPLALVHPDSGPPSR